MDYNQIILELLDRVKTLEKEVELLKSSQSGNSCKSSASSRRNKTRYLFNGKIYLKNHLVLAVVKNYVLHHPSILCQQLKQVFSKTLQGSFGVIENAEIASTYPKYEKRFFTKTDTIKLFDGNMFVCSQWDIKNISRFLKRAEQLGFKIEKVEY